MNSTDTAEIGAAIVGIAVSVIVRILIWATASVTFAWGWNTIGHWDADWLGIAWFRFILLAVYLSYFINSLSVKSK